MKPDHGANDEEAMAQPDDIVRGLTTKAAKIGLLSSSILRNVGELE